MAIFSFLGNPDFWFGVLRSTTPILLAALAALMARRCGVINMAIEGIMLFSAFGAAIVSAFTGHVIFGVIAAMIIGIILSLVLTFFKLYMKADEIMVAIALNLLAVGGTVFLLFLLTGSKSTSSALKSGAIPSMELPLINQIPFLGKIVSNHNLLVYVALIAVFVIQFILFKTPLGLRIRAVGGNEHSAESVGVSVEKTQYIAMAISGVLSGLAGAYMSMGYLTMFTAGMVSGRGYIALAASSVGGAAPFGTFLASILFGMFDQLGNQLQTQRLIAPEFIYMIPYIATIVMYTFYTYRKKTARQRQQQKMKG
ncbi:MAG: ABC transporter permease [Aerococcaceae bacterium]|nr:ABC transporter permease [Aerococcaceae bacterium]